MRYILTIFLTLFLTNCVAGMKPEDFSDQKPTLIIEELLTKIKTEDVYKKILEKFPDAELIDTEIKND